MDEVVALILAAGLSKRMKSETIKVLHRVGGAPAVARVVRAAGGAGAARTVVVVGHQGELVKAALGAEATFVEQPSPRGTGDAVLCAESATANAENVLVLYGDGAILTSELIGELLRRHREGGAAATLLTGEMDDPAGYGRIVRGPDGVQAIIEDADCTPEQRRIREWYTGVACYRRADLYDALHQVGTANAKGEVYLTDAVGVLVRAGRRVEAYCSPRAEEAMGVDDRADLAEAERIIKARVLARLFQSGVTVRDPATTYVDERAEIGRDTILEPMTIIEGACRIGREAIIGPGAHLVDSDVGDGARITHSVVEHSRVADGCAIGPFAHLRPGTVLGADVEVGNYAEIKNSTIGAGSKAHHHSYVGDADLGERVNVGAGVITVNYDGQRKHRTVVADGAFLGCNVNLIAPITVGQGAYVAAGSTVNQPVPAGALAIARERQSNKDGWAARRDAQHDEKG
ncbi:MAG TPA: bifunctional UDP-N-acetylglucosamine diphosphorylase/glucosamine-1-phosphate N-acetyltransferase GlmU [Bacillota bacterium]|nr:bifunctional UDP-N-acetylglucosamine diphosphorylase/glucosamine-1-phosphate N-acetyltransferase GlmU [Bacillota bacterium]